MAEVCRGYRIQILAHSCRAQCARWGEGTFNCCNSGHAGSAACLQNHKTSFKMLPSHILNSIGGSVWRNCWETNSSFVLVDDSTVLSGRISATNSSAALAWSSDAGQGRRMGREVWKRKTLSPLPGQRWYEQSTKEVTQDIAPSACWVRGAYHPAAMWQVTGQAAHIPANKWIKSRKRPICYNTMLH